MRKPALLSLLCVIAACGAARAQQQDAAPLAVQQVAPGLYVHYGAVDDWLPTNGGDVANIGFVVGSRCVAVVDTGGTPAIGQRLKAAIARTTPLPVCYVIHTHEHPDHVLGDGAFVGTGTTFVAHAKFAAALSAREPYYRNALQRDFGIALAAGALPYPTTAVDKRLELDLGGRVLQLDAWPTAHTDNDLTVYDRTSRTLFTGDLLFVDHLPVLDGSVRGWLSVLDELGRLDVAQAVAGHGRASGTWPQPLAAERRYLLALRDETRAAIKQKRTLQEAVDTVGREAAAPWQLVDRFHRRNVTAAYAELEWEE